MVIIKITEVPLQEYIEGRLRADKGCGNKNDLETECIDLSSDNSR